MNISPKFKPKAEGPFTIIKQLGYLTYQLELPKIWKIHNNFHAVMLKPYIENETYGAHFNRPPPDIVNEEEEYEVRRYCLADDVATVINTSSNGKAIRVLTTRGNRKQTSLILAKNSTNTNDDENSPYQPSTMNHYLQPGNPAPKDAYDVKYERSSGRLPAVLFPPTVEEPQRYDRTMPSIVVTGPNTPPGVLATHLTPEPRHQMLFIGNARPIPTIYHRVPPAVRFAQIHFERRQRPRRQHIDSIAEVIPDLTPTPTILKKIKKKISKTFHL